MFKFTKARSHRGKMSTQSVPLTHQNSIHRLYFEEFGITNKIINPQANIKWSHENFNKIVLKTKDGFLIVLNIVQKLFSFNLKMYAHSHTRSVAFSYPSLLLVFSLSPPSLSLPLLSMPPPPAPFPFFLSLLVYKDHKVSCCPLVFSSWKWQPH